MPPRSSTWAQLRLARRAGVPFSASSAFSVFSAFPASVAFVAFFVVTAFGTTSATAQNSTQPSPANESLVGVSSQLKDVVLPGTELEAKPQTDRREPIVLRILQTYPHGTAFRYDLDFYGLEAGSFDLTKWLQRKDGSPTTDLPPLPVTVVATLPPGHILPHTLPTGALPNLGGYRLAVGLGMLAWLSIFAVILYWGRKREPAATAAAPRPATLADRLRPLVEQGAMGTLSPGQCAELERTLLTYWTRKLGLRETKPADLYPQLQAHPEAGPLLQQLAAWLHRRPGSVERVDVEKLLRPYRASPAEAFDASLTSKGAV